MLLGFRLSKPQAPFRSEFLSRLRAARSGLGDGRVYHLRFTVADELGLACTGEVTVCVPHNQGRGRTCGDGGALFASGPGGA